MSSDYSHVLTACTLVSWKWFSFRCPRTYLLFNCILANDEIDSLRNSEQNFVERICDQRITQEVRQYSGFLPLPSCAILWCCTPYTILVPRGCAPFGQHQESRPLANTGSPRFTDFPSLCACSESILTNLIGSGLNLLCLQSHSNTECRWTRPEVVILGADQKERGLWGREWPYTIFYEIRRFSAA